ncbi:HlyC/CorC family transporter [Candidatus Gracilibacteria bacterium]|nr:HlyC/CorC family transporter [Candidatus Gracilibacteria bacterium]
MDPSIYFIFILLFVLSGFFSGTEIALMSLPSHKIESIVKQKLFGAKSLAIIKSNTDRLLITILVGNNLVNVYTAALATQISLTFAQNSGMEEAVAVAIATGAITFLLLMFGEIIPKSFASKNAESISLLVSPVYRFLMILLFPIIWIIEKIIKLFTGTAKPISISDEEIETFLDMGRSSGTLEDDDHTRLKNTLEFSDTLIEEIMIPRVKLEALSDEKTVSEALEFYMKHTHSRIPVFHETIDDIVGIITIRDLLREKSQGHESRKLSELHFKKLIKAPLSQPIDVLLEIFKESRQHMSIVIDEYGGVAGIVTLEDIIEEVFGEIHDETDYETDEIIENGNNSYTIDSSISMDDILEEFELEFSDIGFDEKEFGSETVSYILTHELERFPEKNETICFNVLDDKEEASGNTLCFTILEVEDAMIGKIEVTLNLVKSDLEG